MIRRAALILPPYLWLLFLFLVPFGIVLKISLSDLAMARPPYMPQYDPGAGIWDLLSQLDFENFAFIGAGAIFAFFIALVIFGLTVRLIQPRLLQAIQAGGQSSGFADTLAALIVAVASATIALSLLFVLIDFLLPALRSFVEVEDRLYFIAYMSSLKIALVSTLFTLLVGFPIAYGMARSPDHWRPTLMMLIILPFWTSFLIRVYAWMGILSTEGFLNQFLLGIGVINEPLTILNTNIAVYIGIVYTYLPFMVLPIYATLEKLDDSLNEAAVDLGCSRTSAFWLVTIPLSKPGVIAGCFLVFIPTIGEFVIPSLLGGSDTLMIGKVLWNEFFSNRDWPLASAVAIILLLLLIIPIILFQRNEQKLREAGQ